MNNVILFSFLHKLMTAGIGAFAIYLGYRLFLALPDKMDSAGKIILPGGVNIVLSRVGPGIFFSLFGSLIIGAGLFKPTAYSEEQIAKQTADQGALTATTLKEFRGSNQQTGPVDVSREGRLADIRRTIIALNELPTALKDKTSKTTSEDFEPALRRSKAALIHSVWAKEWGDYAAFESWAVALVDSNRSKFHDEPAKLFEAGQP